MVMKGSRTVSNLLQRVRFRKQSFDPSLRDLVTRLYELRVGTLHHHVSPLQLVKELQKQSLPVWERVGWGAGTEFELEAEDEVEVADRAHGVVAIPNSIDGLGICALSAILAFLSPVLQSSLDTLPNPIQRVVKEPLISSVKCLAKALAVQPGGPLLCNVLGLPAQGPPPRAAAAKQVRGEWDDEEISPSEV